MSAQDHGRLLRVCAYCKQAVVAAVVEYRRPALQRRTNALIIHCACVQFCVVESLRSAGVAAQSFDVRLNPTRSMCTSCCKIIFRGSFRANGADCSEMFDCRFSSVGQFGETFK